MTTCEYPPRYAVHCGNKKHGSVYMRCSPIGWRQRHRTCTGTLLELVDAALTQRLEVGAVACRARRPAGVNATAADIGKAVVLHRLNAMLALWHGHLPRPQACTAASNGFLATKSSGRQKPTHTSTSSDRIGCSRYSQPSPSVWAPIRSNRIDIQANPLAGAKAKP